jgi:ABC-type multidrug transport system fused ATPase/permease subunit
VSTKPIPSKTRVFVRLVGFLKPYRWSLVVSSLLAVAAQFAGLTIPWLTGKVIDDAIPEKDGQLLALLVGLVIVFGVLKALLMLGRRLIAGRQALAVEFDIRNRLYGHLLRLSFRFFDRFQTGQLMSRATADLQHVRFFLGYGLIFLTQHVLTVVGVTVILLILDWQLALVALAITPAVIAVAFLFSRTSHPILREVQQRLGAVTANAEEGIVGVNVVKSFAQESRVSGEFDQRVESLFTESVRATRNRSIYNPLLSFLPLIAQAAVLLVGGRRVISGELTLGAFVAFNVYVLMLVLPLRMLGLWVAQAQRATASGERVFEILDEPEGVVDLPDANPLPAGPGRVSFESVNFGYHPDRQILHDIDLVVESGTTVALVGATGSGKTTLSALIPRFYEPSSGRIVIDGADTREVTRQSLRSAIGVVSQDPFLFSATIHENIAFGAAVASEQQVEAAARAAQAHSFIAEMEYGYDTVIGERGVTLSGGQRQRIAIARALLVDPRILILDDATSSVDARTEAAIRDGLRALLRGRTTIIIAHRLSTIALADQIVVLEDGRVVAHGQHDTVLDQSQTYREIVEHGHLAMHVDDDPGTEVT